MRCSHIAADITAFRPVGAWVHTNGCTSLTCTSRFSPSAATPPAACTELAYQLPSESRFVGFRSPLSPDLSRG